MVEFPLLSKRPVSKNPHLTTERVIMDPSRGYISPVYDFMMRRGENLPLPSDNDHSHSIMDLGNLIERKKLLRDVIGNRPYSNDDLLKAGLDHIASDHSSDESPWNKLRARNICSLDRGSGERHEVIKFYFGNLKDQSVWIFLHAYDTENSRSGEIITCTTLDAKSMGKIFAECRHWSEEKIGRQVLHGLKSCMALELARKRARIDNFEEVFSSVNDAVQLELAASIPRPRD